MKKFLVVFLAAILYVSVLSAKIITVSNNPGSPGQYKRLDSAIYFAAPYDILLVSGSNTDYAQIAVGSTIVITKPLTLYGQGYDPRKDQPLASNLSNLRIMASGSGTRIAGFSISTFYEDAATDSIVITRCKINNLGTSGFTPNYGISGNNYTIRENIIGQINIRPNSGNILIQNNILGAAINGPSTINNIIITNNYFTSTAIGTLYNATVNNNVFYNKSTTVLSNVYSSTVVNCNFSNNIYYNVSNANPFPIGLNSNTGAGNIGANPAFVSIDLTSSSVTRTDNFNLQAGSPAKNAGTDGKDIGLHGGSIPMQYPYSGQPAIPQIQSMNILNPVIPPNGTLNVTLKASSNN